MIQKSETERLTFVGEVFETLKTHSEKMKIYEEEKLKLQRTCLTCDEYESAIRALTIKLKL